jgi:hypothetical protein
MAGDRPGRVYKGERKPLTVRLPLDHHARHFAAAARLGIPMGDYVMCRIAMCDGLPIPPEFFESHPLLVRLYEPPEWPEVLAALPPEAGLHVVRRLRRAARSDAALAAELRAACEAEARAGLPPLLTRPVRRTRASSGQGALVMT